MCHSTVLFADLAASCAPQVHAVTLEALVRVESGFNPYAIGVVRGRLARQPSNAEEAAATVHDLERLGYNYSAGIAQINKYNWRRYGLDAVSIFDPCKSLNAGASILAACFKGAKALYPVEQQALQAAFSCYYSGNYRSGFRRDFGGQPSYVQKVLEAASSHVPLNTRPSHRTD